MCQCIGVLYVHIGREFIISKIRFLIMFVCQDSGRPGSDSMSAALVSLLAGRVSLAS